MSPTYLKKQTKSERFWLCYDFGLQGDYGPLYAWLDRAQAQECGDSAATFNTNKTREQVSKELARLVKGGRLYLIGKAADGRRLGGFVLGHRKRAPWLGFGESTSNAVDEE